MAQVTPMQAGPGARADTPRHYVRVTRANHRGYTEFQFSIGDPTLYLEMTLPPAAFAEFCARHDAVHLTPAEARAVDAATRRWQAHDEHEGQSRVD